MRQGDLAAIYAAVEAAQDEYSRALDDQFDALFGEGASSQYRNINFDLDDDGFHVTAEAVNPVRLFSMVIRLDEEAIEDEDASSDRELHIEICQRQFGGDKWDRYADEYLAEVAERAIEQAHAHAIGEDERREAERFDVREKNIAILARNAALPHRYFSIYGDDVLASAAGRVLDAAEADAREENDRRNKAALDRIFDHRFGAIKFSFAMPGHLLR